MVTWLESIKAEVEGGLSIEYKTFSLDQQNSQESPDFMMWEHPDYPARGVAALAASKAAKGQGEKSFLSFHLATFRARHHEDRDIADLEVLTNIARDAGLDLARFEQDLNKKETWQAVGKDHMESKRKYDAFGVPTVVFKKGQAIFIKLGSLPESKKERLSLFGFVSDMGAKRPYLRELKRP